MTSADILRHRLAGQGLTLQEVYEPERTVSALVAMQAQEYAQAKWAIGLRTPGASDASIEAAFNSGAILRTHLLRPTWHFVTPADIRWLLALTAPRVHAANAYMYRKLELDAHLFNRCNNILAKELEGGKHETRTALNAALKREAIKAEGLRLGYIFMQAELEGLICSGPRAGKQFTYALLEERVASGRLLHTEEALAELSLRYFTSRGPATVHDFAAWSGLSIGQAREGAATLPAHFSLQTFEGAAYFFDSAREAPAPACSATFLMPDYDEYGMSYKDRNALFGGQGSAAGAPAYKHMLVIDCVISGTWEYVMKGKTAAVKTAPAKALSKRQTTAVTIAVKRFEEFVRAE